MLQDMRGGTGDRIGRKAVRGHGGRHGEVCGQRHGAFQVCVGGRQHLLRRQGGRGGGGEGEQKGRGDVGVAEHSRDASWLREVGRCLVPRLAHLQLESDVEVCPHLLRLLGEDGELGKHVVHSSLRVGLLFLSGLDEGGDSPEAPVCRLEVLLHHQLRRRTRRVRAEGQGGGGGGSAGASQPLHPAGP